MLYNTGIGIESPNYGAQFNKCGLQGCSKYALINDTIATLTLYTTINLNLSAIRFLITKAEVDLILFLLLILDPAIIFTKGRSILN